MKEHVINTISECNIIGVSNASSFSQKEPYILKSLEKTNKLKIILADPIRSTATLISALSHGATGVIPVPKISPTKQNRSHIFNYFNKLGKNIIEGGELFGEPLKNSKISNSPSSILSCDNLEDAIIYFYCSNLGSAAELTYNFLSKHNYDYECYLASYYNQEKVINVIRKDISSTIVVVSGGFYGSISSEDFLLSGLLLEKINAPLHLHDDEAMMMRMAYIGANQHGLDDVIKLNSISRWLTRLNKKNDIDHCINSESLPSPLKERVKEILPTLHFINNIPIFLDNDQLQKNKY